MEEDHSTINNINNNANDTVQTNSLSSSRRLQIRRGILRESTSIRSSPYNSALSNLRRRQASVRASETISNLIPVIDNNTIQNDINLLTRDQDDIESFSPDTEIAEDSFSVESDDENDDENFEVLVDFSNSPSINLTSTNENNHLNHEENPSYHSLSTVDYDPYDDFDDEYYDHGSDPRFYYTSTSIPIMDYASSPPASTSTSTTSATEPLIIHNNPLDLSQHRYYDEYSSLINNHNSNANEDLGIEIILETPQNNTISRRSRRRHSIISSNIRNNRGLRLSDILSIPQKLYSSLKEQIIDDCQRKTMINTQCYICLEDFQSTDLIKILNCQHVFHKDCIHEWLRSHRNCAYCRTPVVVDLLRPILATTAGRRQRIRTGRNTNTMTRTSTNNLLQPIPIESSTFEQQQS